MAKKTTTPPTADATEALARVLRESAEPFGKVDWMEFARRAAAKGVTLPPPAEAPSPTPLQAASAAVHAELMDRFGGAKLLYTRLDTDGIARAVLAAGWESLNSAPKDEYGLLWLPVTEPNFEGEKIAFTKAHLTALLASLTGEGA